jgi:PAS domain S-box-containing protein
MAAIEEFAVDVVRSIPAGVLSLDLEGRVHVCNARAAATLGCGVAELRGRLLREVWPAAEQAGVLGNWQSVVEQSGYWEAEALPLEVPSGEKKHLSFKVHPLLSGEGGVGGALAIIEDVTEKLLLEAANRRNERLALVGRMAATIIHDFKNPMTVIKGFMPLLADAGLSAAEREEYSQIVTSEVDRMVGMTQELLDFTKGGAATLRPELWHVPQFLDEVSRVLERELTRDGVELRTEVGTKAQVLIDADKMKRVFFNIAFNARDAMKGGGLFVIRATDVPAFVHFDLRDNGPGIPEEIQESLFQPFVTAGKATGTGLGLAIAKQIVESHGGTIGVESTPGQGATFCINLKPV